jgi:hypothetical protein
LKPEMCSAVRPAVQVPESLRISALIVWQK